MKVNWLNSAKVTTNMTMFIIPYEHRQRYAFSLLHQHLRRTNPSQAGPSSSHPNQHRGMEVTNQVSRSPLTGAEGSGRDLKCQAEPLAKFYRARRDRRFFLSVVHPLAV